MIKIIASKIFCFLILFGFTTQFNPYSAQKFPENIYYFSDEDSTKVGVKSESGKIIIPLRVSAFWGYDFKNPVQEEYLEFYGTDKIKNRKKDSPLSEAGEVYDRKGNFLYYPQSYDNGLDYFKEGFRRFVEGDKMGFVNKSGQKVIAAEWDFATPFSYGYAKVYTGNWEKKYAKGGEHWYVVAGSKDSESFLINKKGEKTLPFAKQKSDRDYLFEGEYYPDSFIYNEFEQKIVDKLNATSILNEISIAYCSNCTPKSDWNLNFEITEYPTEFHPFYTLQGFAKQRSNEDLVFLVSKDGHSYFHLSYSRETIPLEDWISIKKVEIKEYREKSSRNE